MFGCANAADVAVYQAFTFLVFTFYYTIVGLNVDWITMGFVVWSVWNAFNDPLQGWLSDRTHTKWGRRFPYIAAAFVPLGLVMVFIFLPPQGVSEGLLFAYFLFIICLFDWVYTAFSLNLTSLFPESFISLEDRAKANNLRQIFTILGLMGGFIIPTLVIPDLTDATYLPEYQLVGVILCVLVVGLVAIFLKWGKRERPEFCEDYRDTPGFLSALKIAVHNKAFMWHMPLKIASWYVFGMLPTIIPLYGKFVLGITNSLLLSVLLGVAFLAGAGFMSLWRRVVTKIGAKRTWMVSTAVWVVSLLPLFFITTFVEGLVCFFFVGLGLSGALYMKDIIVSDIIDEDEVNTGLRREASYYGINALFMRFSTIFVFLSINMVFNSVGWKVFEPESVTPEIILGLRLLMFVFPAIALAVGIVFMVKYPLDPARLQEVKRDLDAMHAKKRARAAPKPPHAGAS